eukprot:TRINITY_DN4554_c0_g1_i2.p1 TRINITY_DN4554_c0_g1~~TRINITY_DN4554_c0_g1_i2.p1  ORF type:complete len:372 (-),score=56.20 TRINITY_DN4554_c0_g1_i2:302-1417(-)
MLSGPLNGKMVPTQGRLAAIPEPRPRTPSPVREVQANSESLSQPLPARDFNVDVSIVDVVYAEDEEVFRETAIREMVKMGFTRSNIHEAGDGLEALGHLSNLQSRGNQTMPLLVLLDIRMPGMDGKECALQIQELIKKRLLRREPFVISISSVHREIIFDEGNGNFQIVLPKPFTRGMMEEAVTLLKKWWTLGVSRALPAWKHFSPSLIDVIAADEEPLCRLSAATAFQHAGIEPAAVVEADDEHELIQLLEHDVGEKGTRPLIVLLGSPEWAPQIRTYSDGAKGTDKREPFVVCTSVDSDRIGNSAAVQNFHALLPRSFGQSDVRWCLEVCRLWWLSRGDGPKDDVDFTEQTGEDSCSELSKLSDDEEED